MIAWGGFSRLLIVLALACMPGCAQSQLKSPVDAVAKAAADSIEFVDVAFRALKPQHATRPLPEPVRTVVKFTSDDADLFGGTPTVIEAALYRPLGRGPFPAVVALHDCMGLYGPTGTMNSHVQDWAERLVAQGYAVLMPDSFNPRGVPEMCSRNPDLIRPGMERARDAASALAWLEERPWVVHDRVALVGWANGGTTALTFATTNGRLAPARGRFDFRAIVAFYPNCTTFAQAPGWRADMPTTLLIGAKDNWAPIKPCSEMATRMRAGGAQLDFVRYEGAGHDFDAPGMPLHLKGGLTTTSSGGAIIGTDPIARANALDRVGAALEKALAP